MEKSYHFGKNQAVPTYVENSKRDNSACSDKGKIDRIFLLLVIILTVTGTVMIASAGSAYALAQYGYSFHFISRQVMFAAIGMLVMFGVSQLSRDTLYKYTPALYVTTAALLVLVLLIGVNLNGAKRWINLGFATFQPSELAKLSIVMMLARYFTGKQPKIVGKRGFSRFVADTLIPFGYIGIFCGLIALEKHLSGIIIIGMIGCFMIFIAGARMKNLISVGSVGVSGVAAFALFTDYTKKRIDIWRNPELYPRDGGWQTIQGKMAIGSGGLWGLGLGNSRLKYSYVSEPANDFIFTVTCEELGFFGALLIIFVFALLIYRGFVIAMHCDDSFSRLVALGIASKTAIQVILNIAVVTNVFPNTGIALPFFSYGGTSLIILLTEMGIMLSVSRRSKIRK